MGNNEITQQFLKEYFKYCDGQLVWIKSRNNRVKIGQPAGTRSNSGYIQIQLKGKIYYEHRLIWLYNQGKWPKDQLDHINGVRDDNRIENLREATIQQNNFNKKSYGKTSAYKGVSWSKRDKKWRAAYGHKGKVYHVGLYETEIEAAGAYRRATEHLHKDYANYE